MLQVHIMNTYYKLEESKKKSFFLCPLGNEVPNVASNRAFEVMRRCIKRIGVRITSPRIDLIRTNYARFDLAV